MDFSSINWLAVIVAGIAAWALGALWYSSLLFGKVWQKETGLTEEALKNTKMAQVYGTSAVLMIIMALGLAMFFQEDMDMNWKTGFHMGSITGLFFVAPSIGINYLYQRKSLTLWAIDAVYQILFLALAGAIVGGWR